jgi:hypothetical protein
LFDQEALLVASKDAAGVEKISITLSGKPNVTPRSSLLLEPSGPVILNSGSTPTRD